MFFIFGTRSFGKCDKVGALFYVVTQFFHINFVPLIPTKSYIVLKGSESGGRFRGMQFGLCGRSILHAYARAGSIIGIAVGLIGSICTLAAVGKTGGDLPLLLTFFVVLVASAIILVVSYTSAKASYVRALELAEQIGIPNDIIEREYGAHSSGERPFDRNEVKDALPADYDAHFQDGDRRRTGW